MAVTYRLIFPHPSRTSGLTIYGVQWGNIGGVVVGGVEEAFNQANWATYARTLTELGTTGIYSFAPDDALVDVAAGQVTLFQQVGVSPSATLDTYLGHASFSIDNGAPILPAGVGEIASVLARLPAALVGGRMDSSVGAMAASVLTAAALAADAASEIAVAVAALGVTLTLAERQNIADTLAKRSLGSMDNANAASGGAVAERCMLDVLRKLRNAQPEIDPDTNLRLILKENDDPGAPAYSELLETDDLAGVRPVISVTPQPKP